MKRLNLLFLLMLLAVLGCSKSDEYVEEIVYPTMSFSVTSDLLECDASGVEVMLAFSPLLTEDDFKSITASVSLLDAISTRSSDWDVEIIAPTFGANGLIELTSVSYIKVTPGKEIASGTKIMLEVSLIGSDDNVILSICQPIEITEDGEYVIKAVPHIYIDTENSEAIVSKEDYLNATVTIDGAGSYEDFSASTRVKGRGNSTWGYAKKPYKLKLDEKASVLGLGAAKEWVLLANYIDATKMLNAVAMYIGQSLGIPFTNHMIPVDVTVNGEFMGHYMLTEQVEVGENRVDISDDGFLLELDTNYDEPGAQFKSALISLPVMVKDPDIDSDDQLAAIEASFNELEAAVMSDDFPNNNYEELIDLDILASYLLVFNIMQNNEINHPKSVYLYKDIDTKYTMGPLWDFDWCAGYNSSTGYHFTYYSTTVPSFSNTNSGAQFFTRFFSDPNFVEIYKAKWEEFLSTHLTDLYAYIDRLELSIAESVARDYMLWSPTMYFTDQVASLKKWLAYRTQNINSKIAAY